MLFWVHDIWSLDNRSPDNRSRQLLTRQSATRQLLTQTIAHPIIGHPIIGHSDIRSPDNRPLDNPSPTIGHTTIGHSTIPHPDNIVSSHEQSNFRLKDAFFLRFIRTLRNPKSNLCRNFRSCSSCIMYIKNHICMMACLPATFATFLVARIPGYQRKRQSAWHDSHEPGIAYFQPNFAELHYKTPENL